MKHLRSTFTRTLMLLVLCFTFIAVSLSLPDTSAEAAAKKPSIAKEMTIPIGKMDSKVCWNTNSIDLGTAEKLSVKNTVKGAAYSFTSSDTKVVTINKAGGYLTGLKAGTATITCTQTLKGKKTTVGKCKVTVKKPAFKVNEYSEKVFATGSGSFDLSDFYSCVDPMFHIEYRNQNATYSLTSDSEDFTIKEIKCDASTAKDASDWDEYVDELKRYIGNRYFYGYQFTAKKAGTFTVTVKETLNKKTVTLGSFKVEIKDPTLAFEEIELLIGSNYSVYNLVNYRNPDKVYYYVIEDYDNTNIDNNPVQAFADNYDSFLYGNKLGTAKVSIREDAADGPLIGTITVSVIDAPCQEILLDETEYTTYVGDEYFNIYFDLDPWDTTDTVTITSDNPKVLNVVYDEEEKSYGYQVLEAGTANVTIQCGNKSVVCKVTVEEEEEW